MALQFVFLCRNIQIVRKVLDLSCGVVDACACLRSAGQNLILLLTESFVAKFSLATESFAVDLEVGSTLLSMSCLALACMLAGDAAAWCCRLAAGPRAQPCGAAALTTTRPPSPWAKRMPRCYEGK